MEKVYLAVDSECYLEIHDTEDGWDYTLYNFCLDEIDGGVFESVNFKQALRCIALMHGLMVEKDDVYDLLYELDHETFWTIRELMNK